MKNNGFLVISLDFELLWGIFDVVEFSEKEKYMQNTLKVIPRILDLFQENQIHCTWATVGMLFNKDWQEWKNNQPNEIPGYNNKNLSAYHFGNKNSEVINKEILFAPDLIKRISETPFQELGSHTYSHYYCNEEGQNLKQFEADLVQMNRMAQKLCVEIKSLVFPRNQLNEDYLKICSQHGIETVRANPADWYWKNTTNEGLLSKIARTGDAYFPWGKSKSYPFSDLKKKKELPLAQKASRFLRPIENNQKLRQLKLQRIKKEMDYAARNGEIYHLWWHPHNFGLNPEESIQDLKQILSFFHENVKKHDYRSSTMIGIKELVDSKP